MRWTQGSIIFQGAQHALDPVIRVGDQIAEPILAHGPATRREAMLRAGELLEHVGLPSRRSRDFPHEFSGGQKQRVMIAMALACQPDLVIADEPTTALDVMVQAQVLRLLKRLQDDLGLSMLFITHDLSVLVEVSDRLAVMYAGRIVEEGPADEVFRDPAAPYTQALAGAFPQIGDERFIQAPTGLAAIRRTRESCRAAAPSTRGARGVRSLPDEDPPLFPAGEGRRAACLLVEPALSAAGGDA